LFFRLGHAGHIFSLKNDPAGRRFNQPQDRQAGGGFAATAFTDNSEGFPLLQLLSSRKALNRQSQTRLRNKRRRFQQNGLS
jgi:hypothetical protein